MHISMPTESCFIRPIREFASPTFFNGIKQLVQVNKTELLLIQVLYYTRRIGKIIELELSKI